MSSVTEWWRTQGTASRVGAVLVAVVVLAAVAGGGVMLAAGEDPDATGPSVEVASPTVEPADTPTSSPTPRPFSPTDSPLLGLPPAPDGTFVDDPEEMKQNWGYPETANFARVRIPKISVEAQVASSEVGGDGQMANPHGPIDVVWYDLDHWDGMGGRPGEGGNAIFSGHVDYAAYVPYANVRYEGKGVFEELGQLEPGDIIEVDYSGETFRYAVAWREQVHADEGDWGEIWSDDVEVDSITLYTCGGNFDPATLQYDQRVVVRAERIDT